MAQFSRIHADNPQVRLLNQAAAMLRNGNIIVYPTDSGYALGCLLGNANALEDIKRIRDLDANHNFTLIIRDLSELSAFAQIDNQVFRLLKNTLLEPILCLGQKKSQDACLILKKNHWYADP